MKRVTLEDVAREAGVSAMTVSRVINDTGRISPATRERVRQVISRLEYRPNRAARTLVTSQTRTIGVIVPDITNPYFSEIAQGIEDVAWENDFSVLLSNTRENPDREAAVLAQIDDSTVDGIILCSSRLPQDALLPMLERQQAVVSVSRQVPEHLASVVRSRHGIGYRALRAADHLIRTGRRRIGVLRLLRSAALVSIEEFTKYVAAQGGAINPTWYVDCAPTWEGGYDHGQCLITEHPELDAIIGGNDLVALGAMRAILESGRRIPDDIAVVGGDDILMARQVSPALTTFRIPKYEVGAMAARLLFERMAGNTAYQEYLHDEELIVRASAPD